LVSKKTLKTMFSTPHASRQAPIGNIVSLV